MGGFSLWHWLIVGLVILLLFGKGRFSDMMGDVAKGIKSFKKGMSEDEEAEQRRLTAERTVEAQPVPPPAPAAPRRAAPAPAPDADRPGLEPAAGRKGRHVRDRFRRAADHRGGRPGGDRPEGPAARDAHGRQFGRPRPRHGQPFPLRPRHDDARGRARGHGEEVAGRQRADHARASRARRPEQDWAEPVPALESEAAPRRRPPAPAAPKRVAAQAAAAQAQPRRRSRPGRRRRRPRDDGA